MNKCALLKIYCTCTWRCPAVLGMLMYGLYGLYIPLPTLRRSPPATRSLRFLEVPKYQFLPAAAFAACCQAYGAPPELPPTIVTATRTAQSADQTLAAVTVIDRAEIERRQARSLPDLLRGTPGLTISNNGGLGKTTSFFLRGTESDHLLVLIDGIRVGAATLGTTAFQDIPVEQIERIEIVRGPRSSLYGSDAVGGVIQIFTRKGAGTTGLTPYFKAGGGSHDTYQLSGGLSGARDNGWFNLGASHLDTEGFNACRGLPFPPGGGCFTFEPDDDGYRNTSGSAHGGYRFANGLQLEGHLLHTEGASEFDGTLFNDSDVRQQVLGGKLQYSPTSFWDLTLNGGRSLDESDNLLNDRLQTTFDTERVSFSLQNDLHVQEGQLLTVGFDYYDDQIDSSEAFAEDSRDNKAGFGQYQGQFHGHDVLRGVRYDDNEQFGGEATGNAAWGYSFGDALRLTAAWGRAFKAPTFNELFFPGFGNPELGPERSQSWELGVSGQYSALRWSVDAFYTEVDEMISFDPAVFAPVNVDEARIYGLEGVVSTRFFGWDLAANLSLMDPENRGAGRDRGNLLPRRSEVMFRFDLDRSFGPVRFGATVFGENRRYDDLANVEPLDGYVLVDLRASVKLHQNWQLEGQVANLLDKEYETARLYNQDDRNFFVALRYTPGSP